MASLSMAIVSSSQCRIATVCIPIQLSCVCDRDSTCVMRVRGGDDATQRMLAKETKSRFAQVPLCISTRRSSAIKDCALPQLRSPRIGHFHAANPTFIGRGIFGRISNRSSESFVKTVSTSERVRSNLAKRNGLPLRKACGLRPQADLHGLDQSMSSRDWTESAGLGEGPWRWSSSTEAD